MKRSFLVICFTISFYIFEIKGLSEKLGGESIIYGLASIAENYESVRMSECLQDLIMFTRSVEDRHVWALKVLDASGKVETGFLYGNNLWIGSHSHCMDISNKKPLQINHKIVAHTRPTIFDYPPYELKFVRLVLKHNNTLQQHTQLPFDFTIQVGLCVPKSCTNIELYYLFQDYLSGDHLNAQQLYGLNLKVENVKTLEENMYFILEMPKFILLLIIFAVVLILVLVGTIIDIKRNNKHKKSIVELRQNIIGKMGEKRVSEVALVNISQESINRKYSTLSELVGCFSLYSNTKALINTNMTQDSVRCIHGIRFFSMLWVCTIHSIFYQADYVADVAYAYRISEDFVLQLITNSTYSVDTFLFLSGFLLAYLFFKSKKSSEGPVNYVGKLGEFITMCFHRWIRLTPAYLIVILLCDVIYTYLRRVSILETHEAPDLTCPQYWWRNLLYINNLYPRSEMCLSWSWYLSLDTQAFVISTTLLIISTIAFKMASFLLVFMILGNILITTYKSYSIGYIPTIDEQFIHLDDIYDFPWNRIGPYLIGVATGYILVVRLQCNLVIGKVKKYILWIVFPSLNLWIIFTLYTRQLSVEFSAIYIGVSRTLWGVGLAWILLACCTGNGEGVNKFLSFPGWIPLSRLTFCAYLLNPLVANTLYSQSESSYNSSRSGFAISVLGVTLATFCVSFIVSLLFESPFILLTKILLRKMSTGSRQEETTNSSNKS